MNRKLLIDIAHNRPKCIYKRDFKYAVLECFNNKQFVKEYDRVAGTNLSRRLSPIENMIDEATKMRDFELLGFIAFVDSFIWSPLMADRKNICVFNMVSLNRHKASIKRSVQAVAIAKAEAKRSLAPNTRRFYGSNKTSKL